MNTHVCMHMHTHIHTYALSSKIIYIYIYIIYLFMLTWSGCVTQADLKLLILLPPLSQSWYYRWTIKSRRTPLKCTYFQVALPLCEFKGQVGDEQSRALSQVKLPRGKEKGDSIKRQVLEHSSEGKLRVAWKNRPAIRTSTLSHSPIRRLFWISGRQVVGSFQLTYRVWEELSKLWDVFKFSLFLLECLYKEWELFWLRIFCDIKQNW